MYDFTGVSVIFLIIAFYIIVSFPEIIRETKILMDSGLCWWFSFLISFFSTLIIGTPMKIKEFFSKKKNTDLPKISDLKDP